MSTKFNLRRDFITKLSASLPADRDLQRKRLESRAPKVRPPQSRSIEEIAVEVAASTPDRALKPHVILSVVIILLALVKPALAQDGIPTPIIENVLFTNDNAPPSACDNRENPFGYTPPYSNILFTDPQWGGVYQQMIRTVPASDHNLYYLRNSFNANGTLMLGIQSPLSLNGTATPWVIVLFDGNGCFLKPLFNAIGGTPAFNWRANWSPVDPNVFYTTGVSGTWPGLSGNINTNIIYAMHPCATRITGISDPACASTTGMAVAPLYQFNRVSTNEPSGPSLSEDGSRIGIVTRPDDTVTADYHWSSIGLTNSTSAAPDSLRSFDLTANYPSGYCLARSAVEKTRYIGNRFLVAVGGNRGSGSPICASTIAIAAMQILDDATTPATQYGFIAQDKNAPWYNGGGHEAWSPYLAGAPGGGYFVYNHVAGASAFPLESCSADAKLATCTTTIPLPVWPLGTNLVVKGASVPAYNGSWTITGRSDTSFSWQLGSTPEAASGGQVSDGDQWEIHSIGLDGTYDVTNFEAVSQLSAQTVHSFWPWGSPLNAGETVTDFFFSGFAANGVSQYPVIPLAGCTYNSRGATATCTLMAGSLPSNWIVPDNQHGSATSTPYVYGVSDPCYVGSFPITASTTDSFSYRTICAPKGAGNGGAVYLGATDELYKCFRGDAVYGNGCIPLARTYSVQVPENFYFQPLPNGTANGDKVQFDSSVPPTHSAMKVVPDFAEPMVIGNLAPPGGFDPDPP